MICYSSASSLPQPLHLTNKSATHLPWILYLMPAAWSISFHLLLQVCDPPPLDLVFNTSSFMSPRNLALIENDYFITNLVSKSCWFCVFADIPSRSSRMINMSCIKWINWIWVGWFGLGWVRVGRFARVGLWVGLINFEEEGRNIQGASLRWQLPPPATLAHKEE